MLRNMTPVSQALAVLAVCCALTDYTPAGLALAVIVVGIEFVVTVALASEKSE